MSSFLARLQSEGTQGIEHRLAASRGTFCVPIALAGEKALPVGPLCVLTRGANGLCSLGNPLIVPPGRSQRLGAFYGILRAEGWSLTPFPHQKCTGDGFALTFV